MNVRIREIPAISCNLKLKYDYEESLGEEIVKIWSYMMWAFPSRSGTLFLPSLYYFLLPSSLYHISIFSPTLELSDCQVGAVC